MKFFLTFCAVLAAAPALAARDYVAEAAYNGDWKSVRKLVSSGASPDARGPNGMTPLALAARDGLLEEAAFLIEKGADVEGRGSWSETPLLLAARNGKAPLVSLLLEKGADANAADGYDLSPLMGAYASGCDRCVDRLIEAGAAYPEEIAPRAALLGSARTRAAFDRAYEGIGRPKLDAEALSESLRSAASMASTDTVRALLALGADPLRRDKYGNPPAFSAARSGSLEVLRLLAPEGFDFSAVNYWNQGLAYYGAGSGNVDLLRWLASKGAPFAIEGRYGYTALKEAARSGNIEAVRFVSAQGLPLDHAAMYDRQTALQEAALAGRLEIVELLLKEAGDSLRAKDAIDPAYRAAAINGHVEVMRKLKRAGADASLPGTVESAARSASYEALRQALSDGGDANEGDGRWNNALARAAGGGCAACVELLLDRGAQPRAGDESPLFVAAAAGNSEVVRLIIARKAYAGAADAELRVALTAAAGSGARAAFREVLAALGGDSALDGLDLNALLAAAAGSPKGFGLVKDLVARGASPKAVFADGRSPLMNAAGSGSYETLAFLLSKGASPRAALRTGSDAGTDVLMAAASRPPRFARALIKAGARPAARADSGMTALAHASKSGSEEVVSALLSAGADVHDADKDGYTPLHRAANHSRCVAALLSAGIPPSVALSASHYRGGSTPLHLNAASYSGSDDAARRMLDAGAPVNAKDKGGATPLMYAAENCRSGLVRMLLQRGADPRALDNSKRSVAHHAARCDLPDPLESVVEALGADFDANAADSSGRTPLHDAKSSAVVRLLLDRGASPSATKDSLFIDGLDHRTLASLKLLADRGGDINKTTGWDNNALTAAAAAGRDDIVSYLLDRGFPADRVDENGNTALAAAAGSGRRPVVDLLLARGAAINGAPGKNSPLARALGNNHIGIARLLMKKGADRDGPGGSDGKSPLRSAASASAALELLLSEGVRSEIFRRDGSEALLKVIRLGRQDLARQLVKKGAPLEPEPGASGSPLRSAVDRGDASMVRLLLELGADARQCASYGGTALAYALRQKKHDIAELLAPRVPNDYVCGKSGEERTDLAVLADSDDADGIRFLLDHGAKVDARSANGKTPLIDAADDGHAEAVRLLLERGAGANESDSKGRTALVALAGSYSSSGSSTETARALLDRYAWSTKQDADGKTALMYAANIGKTELARYLVTRNPGDVTSTDKRGRNALHHAFECCAYSTSTLKVLLGSSKAAEAVAQKSSSEDGGIFPLAAILKSVYGSGTDRIPAAVEMLLAAGADPNGVDSSGESMLEIACSHAASTAAVRILLQRGADPDLVKRSDWQPAGALYQALRREDFATADQLVAKGANLDYGSGRHSAPLLGHFASDGNVKAARYLLDRKASPNAADSEGRAPLHLAAKDDKVETLKLLLDMGADPSLRDHEGNTPLMLAESSGRAGATALLRRRAPQTSLAAATAAASPATAAATPAPAPAPSVGAADLQNIVKAAVQGAMDAQKPAAPPAPVKKAIVSDVDRPTYKAAERPDDVALVVGIEQYSGDVPDAAYAERDAAAVKAHLSALGVPARNLVHLAGSQAGRASLEKYVEQWLPRVVKPESRVFVYFSGHGAPDTKSGASYLVPWDGDPNFLETTAYPVERLYRKLDALKSKQVLVALDACFSGAKGRSLLPKGARPLVSKISSAAPALDGVTALTAADAHQITGTSDAQGHGLFTYYLLRGLNGGVSDFTVAGLYRWLTPKVQDEAGRLNREQTPQLQGKGGGMRLR